MQNYIFPISVSAYSEADANAKLNLLLAIGSFFVDFKIDDLTCAFVKSKLVECTSRVTEKKKSERLLEEFRKWIEQKH